MPRDACSTAVDRTTSAPTVPARRRLQRRGWTLVEVLVAVIIIGILAGLVVPTLRGLVRRADKAAVQTDLRNFALAHEEWAETQGRYADSVPEVSGSLRSRNVRVVSYSNLAGLWTARFGHSKSPVVCTWRGGHTTGGADRMTCGEASPPHALIAFALSAPMDSTWVNEADAPFFGAFPWTFNAPGETLSANKPSVVTPFTTRTVAGTTATLTATFQTLSITRTAPDGSVYTFLTSVRAGAPSLIGRTINMCVVTAPTDLIIQIAPSNDPTRCPAGMPVGTAYGTGGPIIIQDMVVHYVP